MMAVPAAAVDVWKQERKKTRFAIAMETPKNHVRSHDAHTQSN
jgi:hypothetical protein